MLNDQVSAAVEELLAEVGLVHQVTEHLKLKGEVKQVVIETITAILFRDASARVVGQQALARTLFTPAVRQQRRDVVIINAHDRRFSQIIDNLAGDLLRRDADGIELTTLDGGAYEFRHGIL